MSVEILVRTRPNLTPDPEVDSVDAIFYVITNDVPEKSSTPSKIEGW